MGFSVSASFAVAVIASLLALGMLYPAMAGGFEEVSEATQEAGDRRLEAVNTAINVTSACVTTGQQVEVDVENIGSTELNTNRTHVLIDNGYRPTFVARDVDGNTNTAIWAPGQTLHLVYDYSGLTDVESVPAEAGRVAVATEHGVRDTQETVPC